MIGTTLGGYRIIDQIGMGGMATVYRAYQPSVERYVALKVLPARYAQDERFVERFIREARTIARLEHKNILPIFDFGEEEGMTYLAMRYLDGGTLKDILRRGRLPYADIARVIEQTCAALDYAHRQGVVHRDVKPANIILDTEGDAYLTDFGIAKVLEGSSDLTATGATIGTPAYMAPEQSLGHEVDSRTDIYATGIILYEMVLGQVPYQADTPMAVALAHIHSPLPIPSQIDPSIPEDVEAVIIKALSKEPADRFQTANELARAFRAAVAAVVDHRHSDATLQTLIEDIRRDTTHPASRDVTNLKATMPDQAYMEPTIPDQMPPGASMSQGPQQTIPRIADHTVQPARSAPAKRRGFPVALVGVVLALLLVVVGGILLLTGLLGGGGDTAAEEVPATNASDAIGEATEVPPTEAAPTEEPATEQAPSEAPPTEEAPAEEAPTEPPVAEVAVEMYDDFNDPAYEGSLDLSRWTANFAPGACTIEQRASVLWVESGSVEGNCGTFMVANGQRPTGNQLTGIQWDMRVTGDRNDRFVGGLFSIETPFDDGVWGASCSITAHSHDDINLNLQIQDWRLPGDAKDVYQDFMRGIREDQWYTIRLEVNPDTMTFSCYLDGSLFAQVTPDNADELRNAPFDRVIGFWHDAGADGAILIDNVALLP